MEDWPSAVLPKRLSTSCVGEYGLRLKGMVDCLVAYILGIDDLVIS